MSDKQKRHLEQDKVVVAFSVQEASVVGQVLQQYQLSGTADQLSQLLPIYQAAMFKLANAIRLALGQPAILSPDRGFVETDAED